MPYVKAQLDTFEQKHVDKLRISTLCLSQHGTLIPMWELGPSIQDASHRVMFTARHHCCEMMASYVLEGLLEAAMDNAWWQDHVAMTVVPFVDIDGVTAGDQGKLRSPRDHNRDYNDEPIYPSTPAIMSLVHERCILGLDMAIDMHCPWIHSQGNESVFMAHCGGEPFTTNQKRFSHCLENAVTGEVPYSSQDDVPYGTSWNVELNYKEGCGFSKWLARQQGVSLASTMEVSYAIVRDKIINQDNARHFGRDMASAIANYLTCH